MLDTCTFIWLCSSPGKLSSTATEIIDAPQTRLLLSEVSVLEIALKWSAGKLRLPDPPRRWIESQVAAWSLDCRALGREDMYRAAELPQHHRDPLRSTAGGRGAQGERGRPDSRRRHSPISGELPVVSARSDDNDMDRVTPIPIARGLPLAGNLLALLRDMRGFVTERYLELGPVYRIRG